MYCKDCKWRDASRWCQNKKLTDDSTLKDDSDILLYEFMEGGGFWVGPLFGCVHFEDKYIFKYEHFDRL
jgi:hypothetical protein